MRPTTKEIVDGISWVLDEKVAPMIQERTEDKWASSYLRSIKGLLNHISTRSELEADILWNDIGDQRALLDQLSQLSSDDKVWQTLIVATRAALAQQWFDVDKYRSVTDMEAENLCYRELIEQLVVAIHEQPSGIEEGQRTTLHEATVDYLRRQLQRERPLYAEAFSGRPF
jgi:hypothetical protein